MDPDSDARLRPATEASEPRPPTGPRSPDLRLGRTNSRRRTLVLSQSPDPAWDPRLRAATANLAPPPRPPPGPRPSDVCLRSTKSWRQTPILLRTPDPDSPPRLRSEAGYSESGAPPGPRALVGSPTRNHKLQTPNPTLTRTPTQNQTRRHDGTPVPDPALRETRSAPGRAESGPRRSPRASPPAAELTSEPAIARPIPDRMLPKR